MKKGIFTAIILVLALIGFKQYQTNGITNKQNNSQPTPVTVLKVFTKTLSDQVEALGTTHANESVDVTSNVTEKMSSFSFIEGNTVKKDEIIAMLEHGEEKALMDAKKELLAEHERELKRLSALIESKAAAKRQYDERKTQLNITLNEINQIRAQIEDRIIRAPFNGVLGIRNLSVGSLVKPGDIITTIDDLSLIKLDFSVPSLYLSDLKPGVTVKATTPAIQDKTFEGTIQTVNPRVDPSTRSILVRAIIENKNMLLKPGLFMNVSVINHERQALVTSEQAIIQLEKNHSVLVVDPNTKQVSKKTIQIGSRHDGLVEVISGLEMGELVIVSGIEQAKPGQMVTFKKVFDYIDSPTQLLEAL